RHLVAAQLLRRNPDQGLSFAAAGVAGPAGDVAHVQGQALVGVALGDVDQALADGFDADAELLVDLADEGLLRGLARLALAAGEFPAAGQVTAFGATGEEDAAAGVAEDGGYYFDAAHQSGPSSALRAPSPASGRRESK